MKNVFLILSILACDEYVGRPFSSKFVSGFSMSKLVVVKVSTAPNLQSGGVGRRVLTHLHNELMYYRAARSMAGLRKVPGGQNIVSKSHV